ncbi:hypothetical protein [Sphingomonas aquatilis]|uniref:Cell division septum initiation protein DivIVA n=1 Tax=Sphingomonas aquatilis TaxID=93063 RepID=A0AAW3TTH3_9SPHN|nr:hypothetical protein [Sphingomonas aquatilis]MBB3874715.1 cell division septum initiation protein DivIVA [Sphingomonas aquatilis]MCI4655650.1 hypothetical protein [Sphingomonas aquatilis]GEM73599.1 hypothetical protein SAQ01S_33650 [Sphingomonas aquatilis NBRC 16722]
MNPAEMIVAIVALVVIGGVLRARFNAFGPRHSDQFQPDMTDDTRRLTQEVRDLKERIQVLERVITDNRSTSDLDREIERLRHR